MIVLTITLHNQSSKINLKYLFINLYLLVRSTATILLRRDFMKRKRLILGGLIFVLLFSLLPTARARAEDPNLTGSWNGKHGVPVAGWDWDGDL